MMSASPFLALWGAFCIIMMVDAFGGIGAEADEARQEISVSRPCANQTIRVYLINPGAFSSYSKSEILETRVFPGIIRVTVLKSGEK